MRDAPVILIADDDVGFQEIVATAMKRNGFLVAEAHDGKEAVEKAENLKPDLILMDLNMPGENGTEAILDIEQNPETKNMKIIFLTSETNPWPDVKGEKEHVAKEIGAREYLSKSDDLSKIVDRVKEILKS